MRPLPVSNPPFAVIARPRINGRPVTRDTCFVYLGGGKGNRSARRVAREHVTLLEHDRFTLPWLLEKHRAGELADERWVIRSGYVCWFISRLRWALREQELEEMWKTFEKEHPYEGYIWKRIQHYRRLNMKGRTP